jgi:methyltransferase (TIGR00027 family)
MTGSLMLATLVLAANRALETELQHPLYTDPFARQLAGGAGWSALSAMRQASWPGYTLGPDPYLTILTKFFDDALLRVVSESAITQVVILGAGMDTRAYRLGWPCTVTVFEVDRPDVFEHKNAVLDRLGARAAAVRRTVRADLARDWSRALVRAGFDPDRKSAFLMERVQYWEPEVVVRVFDQIRALSSPGSWIGLAALTEETLLSHFMTPFLRKLESIGLPPWRFGIDDPDSWLASRGWATESVVVGAPEASYGRWPYQHVPREHPALLRAFLTQGWMKEGGDAWPGSR